MTFTPHSTTSDDRPAVLHVLHTLRRAGAEVLVRDLVSRLAGRFRFVVAALDDGGPLADDLRRAGAEVHVVGRSPGFDWRCAAALRHTLLHSRIHLIHAHQYTPMTYAAAANLLAGRPARLLFTEHGRHYPDQRRLKRLLANRLFLAGRCDRVTAVGHAVASALVRFEGLDPRRIQVIHNGIDPASMAVPDPVSARSRIRRELAIADEVPVILQVGSLRPVKNHALALDALAELHRLGCPAHLLFAGDGPLAAELQQRAAQLNLQRYVRFLGSRDDVASLWCAADVGLLTSRSEGVSVALLECMAAGKVPVATDVGGNREIIDDSVTGLLAPSGDAPAIARSLFTLLIDPPLRHRMGLAGAQRVARYFHQSSMHRAYADLYDQLTGPATLGAHHAA
jgi:glycosyltransferase involved in cell wall biosynthesis